MHIACAPKLEAEEFVQAASRGDSDRVKELLMAYPALARLQKHPSAASICAERGYIDCLKVLLMHGIDVNSVDNKGRTLLLKARPSL